MKFHGKVPKKQVVGEEMKKYAEHLRTMANMEETCQRHHKAENMFAPRPCCGFAAHAIYMFLQSVNPGLSREFSILMRPGS